MAIGWNSLSWGNPLDKKMCYSCVNARDIRPANMDTMPRFTLLVFTLCRPNKFNL